MIERILSIIKKAIPHELFKKIQPIYHKFLAYLSAFVYGHPSEKMIVVGVTGTAGKSSTCYFISQILEQAGYKVGMTSTTLFKIAGREWLNDKKMTMLGRFQTQKMLKQMVQAGCNIAVVETSSQGVEQFRHVGINYDILVFTNLYPEHIEAHGGFENYKAAKGKLFQYLQKCEAKELAVNNQQLTIKKSVIVNSDDENVQYFLSFWAQDKITFDGEKKFETTLLGDFNTYNINAAARVAEVLNVAEEKIKVAVANLKPLPGRLEFIENNRGLKIIVDYAFEPKAVTKLYEVVKSLPHNKIIHILGSAGGGRDKATQRDKSRRPILGKIAGENADVIIVTNEDPYDEDPKQIIAEVAAGAETAVNSQQLTIEIYKILDRREAIRKALTMAENGDLILVTGKGAEQAICVENGKKIKWDDREVIREELALLSSLTP